MAKTTPATSNKSAPATIAEQIQQQLSPEEQKDLLLKQLLALGVNAGDLVGLGIKSQDLQEKEREQKDIEINTYKGTFESAIKKHLDKLKDLAGFKSYAIHWQDTIEREIPDENGVTVTEVHPEGWIFAYSEGNTIKVPTDNGIKASRSVISDKLFNPTIKSGWSGRGVAPTWIIKDLVTKYPNKSEEYLRDIIKTINEGTQEYKDIWKYLTDKFPPAAS
jgi:hypothetical protein